MIIFSDWRYRDLQPKWYWHIDGDSSVSGHPSAAQSPYQSPSVGCSSVNRNSRQKHGSRQQNYSLYRKITQEHESMKTQFHLNDKILWMSCSMLRKNLVICVLQYACTKFFFSETTYEMAMFVCVVMTHGMKVNTLVQETLTSGLSGPSLWP